MMKNDMSDVEQIPYAKTVYGQEEIDAVVKCLSESTQMGNYSRQFERKIADLFNKKHCLYVNSGSSALYIGEKLLASQVASYNSCTSFQHPLDVWLRMI